MKKDTYSPKYNRWVLGEQDEVPVVDEKQRMQNIAGITEENAAARRKKSDALIKKGLKRVVVDNLKDLKKGEFTVIGDKFHIKD